MPLPAPALLLAPVAAPGNGTTGEMVIASDPSEARVVQDHIEHLLRSCQAHDHDLFGVRLALEEALVNAIKHGNQLDRSKSVTVSYLLRPDQLEVRVTDHLVRLATEDQVLEYVGAFLQLYREEARYLERTAPWVARIGIDYVRRRIVADGDERRAIYRRFLFAQGFVQKDPWGERAAGAAAHEFRALAEVE